MPDITIEEQWILQRIAKETDIGFIYKIVNNEDAYLSVEEVSSSLQNIANECNRIHAFIDRAFFPSKFGETNLMNYKEVEKMIEDANDEI